MYCIHETHIGRKTIEQYDARNDKDEWQDYVYKKAFNILVENKYHRVLDVGCGNAYKLFKYFSDIITTGIEVGSCFSFLRNKYPNRTWHESLESVLEEEFDIIICADVIEHIEEPTGFLNSLKGLNFKFLVMSTPNRDNMPGDHIVPTNPCHYREWTIPEFKNYISQYFEIIEHFGSQEAISKFYAPGTSINHFLDAKYGQCVVLQKGA